LLRSKFKWVGIVCLLLLSIGGTAFYLIIRPGYVYRVYVDGIQVGSLEHLEDYTILLEELLVEAEEETGLALNFAQEVSAHREFSWQHDGDSGQVKEQIHKLVSFLAAGWTIVVDDTPVVWVESEQAALQVLSQVEERLLARKAGVEVVSFTITNEISVEKQTVEPDSVIDIASAVSIITQGQERVDTHVVARGESLWSIARSRQVSEGELKAANPGLNTSSLRVGQTINLVSSEPLVEYRLIEARSVFESIPFRTVQRTTNKLWYYQSRTASTGVAGQQELIYHVENKNGREVGRVLVKSRVAREPQNHVIERGTGTWPTQTTGMFRWPLNTGRITDRFGNFQSWRNQRHTGVDIGAATGTPIYAAAGGTVIRSGWFGGYGYMVEIRHSSGMSTIYAHASRIAPAATNGRQVNKGQVIAYVGSTGSSTGPHLHFEVRQNGTPVDPLRYFLP
jgi:murein DD-endopeptidase MepM/ murein hydrolase activator NlpD